MRHGGNTLGEAFREMFEQLKQKAAPAHNPNMIAPTKHSAKLGVCAVKTAEPSMLVATRVPATPLPSPLKRGKRKLKRTAGRLKQPDLDLSIYGGRTRSQEPTQAPRQSLPELSADMTRLKIRAAKSEASINQRLKPVQAGGRLTAILGLDFGTAFTKAVVRFDQRHYVVDWSGAVTARDPYLLPSSFSEHGNGDVVLGNRLGPGWSHHEGLKMRLLASGADADDDAQCDAVLFIAAVLRYVTAWFQKVCRGAGDPRWRLHLGLPAESWDDEHMTSLFTGLAEAGMSLACQSGALSREGARRALQVDQPEPRNVVAVLPEFACQLYSYLDSAQRQSGIHALMDIGAGTLDVAFFNVHSEDDEDVLPILSATVKTLGTHHLIGALAGKAGEQQQWRDDDAAASDDDVASRVCETKGSVSDRRRAYLSAMARTLNEAREHARANYPTSRTWRDGAPLELFLCGGGSRLPAIKGHIRSLVHDAKKWFGITIREVSLPRPQNLEGGLGEDQYDRISVAYGLSQLLGNVGTVTRRHDLEPLDMPSQTEIEDRDATR